MKYKRLTKKNERGFYHYNCTKEEQEDCLLMENCGECYGTRVLYRLAELEDKIENGTLIELPCKVGDTIWAIYEFADSENVFYEIYSVRVREIHIRKDDIWLEIQRPFIGKFVSEKIFFTREEAEKKLKELQK